jgi:hypothetical protein
MNDSSAGVRQAMARTRIDQPIAPGLAKSASPNPSPLHRSSARCSRPVFGEDLELTVLLHGEDRIGLRVLPFHAG